jgi:N-acetylglucosaminyl-diphospho-decaprenol L-rhamnosyltransferase
MATSAQHVHPVAVVTVSYGSGAVLAGFLDSVPAASSTPLHVVVADNKPDAQDGVRAIAEAANADYVALANHGYGSGMNAAAARLAADVEWILVSNPDVVLRPGAIDALLSTGLEDPAIAAVGPVIVTDDEVYPSARAVPSLRTGVGHALFANIWLDNPWTRAYKRDTDGAPVRRDAGWLSGACFLVRRSAFEQLGGFDEGYFMYFEDVDFGYRLGKAGYRSVYEPSATVVHSGAHSTESHDESARMIAAHHASARRFLNTKYNRWYLWPIRAGLSVGLAIRSGILKRRSGHH